MDCIKCEERIEPPERTLLGYRVCLRCGDELAKRVKHTIAPLNKSNYYFISNPEILKQLNPKRTT
jgi:hypothetical protein